MVSGGGAAGATGLEGFRRLLARAAEEDDARSAALDALCERSVLAATWSDAGDALRTLSNGDGEKAMPLFSGRDTLQAAAQRFGWAKSGALGMRELQAREAMQSALAQGVQFIVLDVGAEFCVEFARDEVALMLAAKQARQRPIGGNAGGAAKPSAERTQLGARGAERAVREVPARVATVPIGVAAPAHRTAPGFGFTSDPPPAETAEGFPLPLDPRGARSADKPVPVPAPAARAASGPAVLPSLSPLPFAAPDAADFGAPITGSAGFGAPAFGAPPPGAPSLHEPAVDAVTGLGFSYGDPEPEARPAALEAAVMVAEVAKLGDASTQKAAAEVAAMLKQMAIKGVDDSVKPMKSAAKAFAAMLGAEMQQTPSEKRGFAAAGAAAKADSAAEPATAAAEHASDDGANEEEELPEEPAYEPGALRPLQIGLSDPLQAAIAEALRSYPEVEWACEVSDGSEVPVVGVRVSPSFMTRVEEIEQAIAKAATTRRVSLRVMLLNEPALMREARAHGNTFFPWRKRPGRK